MPELPKVARPSEHRQHARRLVISGERKNLNARKQTAAQEREPKRIACAPAMPVDMSVCSTGLEGGKISLGLRGPAYVGTPLIVKLTPA